MNRKRVVRWWVVGQRPVVSVEKMGLGHEHASVGRAGDGMVEGCAASHVSAAFLLARARAKKE